MPSDVEASRAARPGGTPGSGFRGRQRWLMLFGSAVTVLLLLQWVGVACSEAPAESSAAGGGWSPAPSPPTTSLGGGGGGVKAKKSKRRQEVEYSFSCPIVSKRGSPLPTLAEDCPVRDWEVPAPGPRLYNHPGLSGLLVK